MSSGSGERGDPHSWCLERLLDAVYDFGPAEKKKPKKKKKRKRCEEEEEEQEELTGLQENLNKCTEIGAEDGQKHKMNEPGPNAQQEKQVEVVTFQDPTKKRKSRQALAQGKPALQAPQVVEKTESSPVELSLEKARLEVHRFGITGYKKEQQRVFEQDRAVMLGAKPPKREYVNYKTLQQQIQEKKQKVKEEPQLVSAGFTDPSRKKTDFLPFSSDVKDTKKKKKLSQRDNKKKKKGAAGSAASASGQVGRFKNGMLILSSKEIQKIKGRR
uniref:Zgc:194224 n=1 Tax=Oryzias sinensis TaxID=183150 RepID=A0A8C7Z995_9TELE